MTDDALEPRDPAARWRPPFGLLGIIVLACLVYEATHSPALASVLVSLKFGGEEFLTARWLRRKDPDPRRGRSLYWLYASWGVWKSAAVALLMATAFAAVAATQPNAGVLELTLSAWLSTVLIAVAGFVASVGLATAAGLLARRGQYRLWLDSGVNAARRRGCWPPTPFCDGRRNHLNLLMATAHVFALCAPAFLFYSLLMYLSKGAAVGTLCLILSVVFLIGVVVCLKAISVEVRAYYPSQCWPERWDLPQP